MSFSKSSSIILFFFVVFSIAIKSSISGSITITTTTTMAEVDQSSSSSSKTANVYIVYTQQPTDESDHESFHLRTLSNVVGSEEAAKESLIYVYKNAATGFSAKLTPEQVSQLEKQPGVIQVVVSRNLQLHSGGGGGSGPQIV